MVWPTFSFLEDCKAHDLTERILESQDKYLPQVAFSNKTLTSKKVAQTLSRKIPCKYDLYRMSLQNISISIVSNRSSTRKNPDILSVHEKLLDVKRKKPHTWGDSYENNQNEKALAHNNGIRHLNTQTSANTFKYNNGGKTLGKKTVIIPYREIHIWEKLCEYNGHEENFCEKSSLWNLHGNETIWKQSNWK